jgi:hypothetical protein
VLTIRLLTSNFRLMVFEQCVRTHGQIESLFGHGWTERRAAHALEPIPLPGWSSEARMQIEAVGPHVRSSS